MQIHHVYLKSDMVQFELSPDCKTFFRGDRRLSIYDLEQNKYIQHINNTANSCFAISEDGDMFAILAHRKKQAELIICDFQDGLLLERKRFILKIQDFESLLLYKSKYVFICSYHSIFRFDIRSESCDNVFEFLDGTMRVRIKHDQLLLSMQYRNGGERLIIMLDAESLRKKEFSLSSIHESNFMHSVHSFCANFAMEDKIVFCEDLLGWNYQTALQTFRLKNDVLEPINEMKIYNFAIDTLYSDVSKDGDHLVLQGTINAQNKHVSVFNTDNLQCEYSLAIDRSTKVVFRAAFSKFSNTLIIPCSDLDSEKNECDVMFVDLDSENT